MWRAFFLALGISLCVLGAECLVIEKAVMAAEEEAPVANALWAASQAPVRKELEPPEWAPWTFLSGGAVVLLYSFTIPKRAAKG